MISFDHVAITVKNLEASIHFYENLGYTLQSKFCDKDYKWATLKLKEAGLELFQPLQGNDLNIFHIAYNFVDDEVTEDSRLDQEDMISERELELDEAISLLLDTVLEEDAVMFFGTETDEVCEDLKDHILEYLYRKHGISVRRPMVLEDTETGEEFFEEYPYDSMVFEDEDNPLYKS